MQQLAENSCTIPYEEQSATPREHGSAVSGEIHLRHVQHSSLLGCFGNGSTEHYREWTECHHPCRPEAARTGRIGVGPCEGDCSLSQRRDWFDRLTDEPWLTMRVDTSDVHETYDVEGYARLDTWLLTDGVPVARALLPAPVSSVPGRHLLDTLGPHAAQEQLIRMLHRHPQPESAVADPLPATVVVRAVGPEHLEHCLQSLAQLSPGVRDVVVVEVGAGTDEVRQLAKRASVRWTRAGEHGADSAAVAEALDELVLFTDGDVRVEPGWAGSLAAAFDDPLVVAATGVVLRPVVTTPAEQLAEVLALQRRAAGGRTYDGTVVHPFQVARLGSSASMAVRAQELRALGGSVSPPTASRTAGVSGEVLLMHSALLAGYRVVHEPAAVSWRSGAPDEREPEVVLREHGLTVGTHLVQAVRRERRIGSAAIGARELLSGPARRAASRVLSRESAPPWSWVRAEVSGVAAAPRAVRRHARCPGGEAEDSAAADHAWLDRLLAGRPVATVSARELPTLSVVIPTRARREKVVRLVRRLQQQEYDAARVEIVIAVDGDVDGTARALDQLDVPRRPRVVVLESRGEDPHHGSGAGTARNAGAAEACGDVLLFLDDDVHPVDDQLLLAHAAGREEHPLALLVGLCPPRMAEQHSYLAQAARAWWAGQTQALLAEQPLRFTDVTTANLSVPRQGFLDQGGFMDVPRREDWELGLRLAVAGMHPVALPAAAVEHLFDTEARGFLADVRREGAGDALMVARHPGALGMLPLESWRSATPRRRQLLAAAVERQRAPRLVPVAGPASLAALERAGLRGRWQRALGLLLAAAYWNGVGDALGSVQRLEEVLEHAEALARRGCGTYDGLTGELLLPAPGAACEVDITAGARHLGRVPLRWGGVPFREDTFVRRVLEVYAAPLLAAHALQVGPAGTAATCSVSS